jgi:uncharacterized membrane protein
MRKLKNISLAVLIIGYLLAGANHFRSPASYIKIIPPYFPHPEILNTLAGFCEISFAILFIFNKTRVFAAWAIVFMLIAFLPVHIKMVRDAPFMLGTLKVTPLIAWIRLVVLQPLLIGWAWWYTDEGAKAKNNFITP